MMMGFGGLAMILWAVLLVAAVLVVGRILTREEDRDGREPGEPDAREILRRRYAAGEISREEFQEKHEALR